MAELRAAFMDAVTADDVRDVLAAVVKEAKAGNMPKDTIEKAIKKGTGELAGESYEEVRYEGYGSGGVAVMCAAVTDNRNRTSAEIKKIFERAGGNLCAPTCVAFMNTTRWVGSPGDSRSIISRM